MSALTQEAQKSAVDDFVTLFQLDATMLGDDQVRYFTSSALTNDVIRFGGNAYIPTPIEATGFEWSGQGAPPQPKLRIANVNRVAGALVRDYDDLVGATVRRIRTFREFLDDGATPDPEAHLPIDEYRIERKIAQNKVLVEFELAAAIDQQGRYLPGRQCLKNACTLIYRRWDGAAFVYDKATCPYNGARYFTRTGETTLNPAEDACGKRLSDCEKRFGNAPLPFGGFPGMGGVRA